MALYDPWAHACELGFLVLNEQPGCGLAALYLGDGVIMLSPKLSWRQARCTLAHEIIHAERDDEPMPHMHDLDVRRERYCDVVSAQRLIFHRDLVKAASHYPGNPFAIAYELGVTHNVLNTYLQEYHAAAGKPIMV